MSTAVVVTPLPAALLESLADSLKRTASETDCRRLSTADFVSTAEALLPFFDHLGPVFSLCEREFETKLQTLRDASRVHDRLCDVIAADLTAGRAVVKGSATRNLHRVLAAILFIERMFKRLLSAGPSAPLRDAASDAYEATLAPIHTVFIRGAVRAGMLTLPSREHFLSALGETEETVGPRFREVVDSCASVAGSVQQLLKGIEFPASDVWFWPSK